MPSGFKPETYVCAGDDDCLVGVRGGRVGEGSDELVADEFHEECEGHGCGG